MTRASDGDRSNGARALALDATQCYWAVFEDPLIGAGGPTSLWWSHQRRADEARRYAFEAWLPLPIDDLECRFVLASTDARGRRLVLACGVERERLRLAIGDAVSRGERIESACPVSIPNGVARWLSADRSHFAWLSALDFRIGGACECSRRTRRRRVAWASVVASLAISCVVVSLGLVRSTGWFKTDARTAAEASSSLAMSSLRLAGSAAPAPGIDPSLALAAAVAHLERTRDRTAESLVASDRGATLLGLLAAWPEAFPTRLEQTHLEQRSITLRGEVRDAADFERLTLALVESLGSEGWVEQSRNGSKSKDAFAFTLTLKRAEAGSGAPVLDKPAYGPTAVSAAGPMEGAR